MAATTRVLAVMKRNWAALLGILVAIGVGWYQVQSNGVLVVEATSSNQPAISSESDGPEPALAPGDNSNVTIGGDNEGVIVPGEVSGTIIINQE